MPEEYVQFAERMICEFNLNVVELMAQVLRSHEGRIPLYAWRMTTGEDFIVPMEICRTAFWRVSSL